MLSVSIQSHCSGEQSRKSSWTTQCSSLLLRKNYYIIHSSMHLEAVTCFVPLGRLFQNLLQLGALIITKQFLSAHIPLFCEDCTLGLTAAAVQENMSEETSHCLYLLKDLSCLPLCSAKALLYSEQVQWHLHRTCPTEFHKSSVQWEQYCLASEGGRMQVSLFWQPQVSFCNLLTSISPSLSPPSQSIPVAPSGQQILLVLCQ